MSNIPPDVFVHSISTVKSFARVAFHFHPDRVGPNLKSVSELLLESGIYKSQFETLLSNGSASAYPGGARDLWESRLFGGAYNHAQSDNSQRPKYGALDLMGHPDGPSPRFGSCYFLLKPEVSRRCTFTYLDSHRDPQQKGTYDEFDDIIAALLTDSFSEEIVLGEERLRPPALLTRLVSTAHQPFANRFGTPHRRVLDHFIEAQVHGEVELKSDVEILVADPSFKNTTCGNQLTEMCKRFGIELYWHKGFSLPVDKVPNDFRGPTMPSLAKLVAPDGQLNANNIGAAAVSVRKNPKNWAHRGTDAEVLQELKLLWHVLLRYGN
ncbi:MAG: hypothetical protein LZF62_40046 [Nitrospira sp.]|nr:MAG: hypothetical protein LZF62_40046 [Nitrospira sp.]